MIRIIKPFNKTSIETVTTTTTAAQYATKDISEHVSLSIYIAAHLHRTRTKLDSHARGFGYTIQYINVCMVNILVRRAQHRYTIMHINCMSTVRCGFYLFDEEEKKNNKRVIAQLCA